MLFERIGVGGMGEVYRCGDDCLQRDLAIKVLRAELRGDAGAEERFLREARLTGSLQHPGVVPIHQMGRLGDGRPCYTMKLVRGRTFADLLRDEPDGPERLPRLLAVVEKVCQAVAFAHSKGVIHRDLKPSNFMVGEFGEVQVMDWGLAKELSRAAPGVPPGEPTENVETVGRVEERAGLSRAGAALGTPAYMPPEQAAGEWDIVDERADVFALGAVLYQVLTGRPPYHGVSRDDLLRRARRGDLAEALGRLERCGADAALVNLCRDCLAVERKGRPRNADVVAKRLAAYQADVQERLRLAELERAAAQIKAQEERKRRRLAVALAALVLLLLTGIGGAVWWQQRQREQADLAVSNGLAQADLLAEQARADPLQTDKYRQALEAARVAAQLAPSASADVRQRAEALITRLQQEEEAARKDRDLLAALLEVRGPRELTPLRVNEKRNLNVAQEQTAEEQFAAAFRAWGLDVNATPTAEAAARLKARPPVVVTEVIAALDDWASQCRQDRRPEAEWRRVAELAALLDEGSDSKRRELREIMARGQLPVERALGVLSAALRPVPIPVELPLGRDRSRLRQIAEQTNAATEPILGILTLVRALLVAGDEKRAEQLLRVAIVRRPHEVVLYHTLGRLLIEREEPRWDEAVECYMAARGVRSDLGVNLATALQRSGRDLEGVALLAQLASDLGSADPTLFFRYGAALSDFQTRPVSAEDYYNRGYKRQGNGWLPEAMADYRQAIRLKPDYGEAHCRLADVLSQQGRYREALDSLRQGLKMGWLSTETAWVRDALRETERLLALEKKLPAILSGEQSPANASEALTLAWMCQQFKKEYAAAARLYAEAFTASDLAVDFLKTQIRYDAAWCAALAATEGEKTRLLPDKVVVMFRLWALRWLRDELTAYAKLVEQNNKQMNQFIPYRLANWRSNPYLASVRDPSALERLPDNERVAWQALWRDVDELQTHVAKEDEPTKGRKAP
jgi:serine/threonine-protein kinase